MVGIRIGLLIVCFSVIHCTCPVNLDSLAGVTASELEQYDCIVVTEEVNEMQQEDYVREYYILKTWAKQKRSAYEQFKNHYRRLLDLLCRNHLVPHENALIKSHIRPKYHSNRKLWSFSLIYMLCAKPNELQLNYAQMNTLNIQRLSQEPSINFLNQKAYALVGFNRAKERMQQFLEQFEGYHIHEIVGLDIQGKSITNEDIIEEQLEEELIFSAEDFSNMEIHHVKDNVTPKKLTIHVSMRIRYAQSEQHGFSEPESQTDSQSDSQSEPQSDSDSLL